jgi:hypothetical protein
VLPGDARHRIRVTAVPFREKVPRTSALNVVVGGNGADAPLIDDRLPPEFTNEGGIDALSASERQRSLARTSASGPGPTRAGRSKPRGSCSWPRVRRRSPHRSGRTPRPRRDPRSHSRALCEDGPACTRQSRRRRPVHRREPRLQVRYTIEPRTRHRDHLPRSIVGGGARTACSSMYGGRHGPAGPAVPRRQRRLGTCSAGDRARAAAQRRTHRGRLSFEPALYEPTRPEWGGLWAVHGAHCGGRQQKAAAP